MFKKNSRNIIRTVGFFTSSFVGIGFIRRRVDKESLSINLPLSTGCISGAHARAHVDRPIRWIVLITQKRPIRGAPFGFPADDPPALISSLHQRQRRGSLPSFRVAVSRRLFFLIKFTANRCRLADYLQ